MILVAIYIAVVASILLATFAVLAGGVQDLRWTVVCLCAFALTGAVARFYFATTMEAMAHRSVRDLIQGDPLMVVLSAALAAPMLAICWRCTWLGGWYGAVSAGVVALVFGGVAVG